MNLSTYLDTLPRGGRRRLAEAIDQSPAYLYQMAQGKRRPNETLAVLIEQATGGHVQRDELLPDVDWALLASKRIRPRKRIG